MGRDGQGQLLILALPAKEKGGPPKKIWGAALSHAGCWSALLRVFVAILLIGPLTALLAILAALLLLLAALFLVAISLRVLLLCRA